MENKKGFQKFKDLNDKLQLAIKIVGALIFLSPLVITTIKKSVPYIQFVIKGPELVENVQELKRGLLVATAGVSANMETIDSTIYKIYWRGHEYKGILSKSKSGIIYVSVRDGEIGEQMFAASYDNKWFQWYFIDFDGNRVNLENE
jgi:hypothetical protein